MAQTVTRPQLVAPRQVQTLEAVRTMTGGFDVDAWHVMEERDNQLISDEILHGAGSSTFVYNFTIQGTQVAGISVVGARHLAAHYKGLKHRLVAAMQKTGSLFTFTSYPAENLPMQVSCSIVTELAEEEDFYAAICEMSDLKTGNSIQIERRELRFEERRGGGWFERPNYATIAQSKAYRNAVLSLVPQDLVIRWKAEMLRLRKDETITDSVLEEKRTNVIRFAAQRAISLDRRAVEGLTLDQIAGLGDAAREGRVPAFLEAAKALGLEIGQGQEAVAAETAQKPQEGPGEARADLPNSTQARPQVPAGGGQQPRSEDAATPPDRFRETAISPGQSPESTRSRRRVDFEA